MKFIKMFILVFTKVTKIVFNHVYIYMHRLIFDVPKIQSEEELEYEQDVSTTVGGTISFVYI